MSFFETEFPRTISYKAVGGPEFLTQVNEGLSGFEQRNKNWSLARGTWNVSLQTPAGYGASRQTFVDLLRSFFLNVSGMGDAFRLYDHLDHQATAQIIGVGDGVTKTFQLQKLYTTGVRSYIRLISKPITSRVKDYAGNSLTDTVNVYNGGVIGTHNPGYVAGGGVVYTLDETTGVVTYASAPAPYAIISADVQFHYPVRFDNDRFPISVEDSDTKNGNPLISIASLQLKEVRIAAGSSQG